MAMAGAGPADRPILQRSGSPEHASTESGRSPLSAHAPFLHNLSQRFRRGSNVSSNTSDSQSQNAEKNDGTTTANPKQQERARADASRAAKRYLMTIVRNDWEFPPTEGGGQDQQQGPDAREPISWQLRDDGSEDELDRAHPTSPTKRRPKADPYRFENPDAVADYVRERQVKRRKIIHEQMSWNHGLRHWVQQRDAWTGAVWRDSAGARKPASENQDAMDTTLSAILGKADIPDSETNTNVDTSPSVSAADINAATAVGFAAAADSHTPEASGGTSVDSLEPATTATTAATDVTSTGVTTAKPTSAIPANESEPDPEAEGPYLPVYPPLFPEDNVLRSRINPSAYGTIYGKIVVQSLTPNIPIPLPDMVRALVSGWKNEGQWPPTGTAPEAARKAGKATAGAGGAGGTAFARWRRDRGQRKASGFGAAGALVEGAGSGKGEGAAVGANGHRARRSISSVVRRVFGTEAEERRRESEVGLSLGFEEDDEAEGLGANASAVADVDADADGNSRLNRGLLDEAKQVVKNEP